MSSINTLVDLLKKASDAYYNGKDPIMDDDSFDLLLDELRFKDPSNPFLKTVGADPNEGAVTLPSYMPSLEKIKPGEPTLTRFLRLSKYYVLSEKLDGLSALWCTATKSLYLRGNGLIGQTISHLVNRIDSLVPSNESWLIRGELVLPKNAVDLGSTPARTVINGLVHKSNPDLKLLKQIKFIAYEVISPAPMKRSDQFVWLEANGFIVPWWILKDSPHEDDLKTFFIDRRTSSLYDTDGIVIGIDSIPYKALMTATQSAPKPPKDCVAFKMPVSDQSAITTVEEVLWAPSAQGYLIPRIRIKPVNIGGAVIEFCTGHNARTIVDKAIGPGAQIKIRRSGDVIPTLDQIIIPATITMPTKYEWEWVGSEADATHIKLVGGSTDQLASQLHLFAKTIDIPGLGPANCKALVDSDITGPAILWSKTVDELSKILGPKTGATLYANLRTKLLSPALTELELLIASNKMPRGTGETKLKSLLITEPNIKNWPTLTVVPQGWVQESLETFQKTFPEYETWRTSELHFIPYPLKAGSSSNNSLKTVCFTGFRDKALEEKIKSTFQVVATVSSKLNILVVPDHSNNHESEKVKKAKALNTVEVLQCSDFIKKYII